MSQISACTCNLCIPLELHRRSASAFLTQKRESSICLICIGTLMHEVPEVGLKAGSRRTVQVKGCNRYR